MRAAMALSALVSLAGRAGAAEAPSTEAFMRALEGQTGVTVTRGDDGGAPCTEWRKAGVFYRLQKTKDGDALWGEDDSGAGAVMCTWALYDEVRAALAACPADRFPALRADLERDVPAIERFIVANSQSPVAPAELHAEAEAGRARAAAQRALRDGASGSRLHGRGRGGTGRRAGPHGAGRPARRGSKAAGDAALACLQPVPLNPRGLRFTSGSRR